VSAFRPLWVALFIVDKIGWQAPLGMTEQLIFFVIFFLGVLMVDKK